MQVESTNNFFHDQAARFAGLCGRESRLIRMMRPAYESLLEAVPLTGQANPLEDYGLVYLRRR